MKRIIRLVLLLVLISATLVVATEEDGEIKVILLFTQTTGPNMLNKIQGDMGITEPIEQAWSRGNTTSHKVEPDSYNVYAKNVEVCSFADCVPCPDQKVVVYVSAAETKQVVFRWKAKYDRVEKKWVCN